MIVGHPLNQMLVELSLFIHSAIFLQGNIPPNSDTDTHELPRRAKTAQEQIVSRLF